MQLPFEINLYHLQPTIPIETQCSIFAKVTAIYKTETTQKATTGMCFVSDNRVKNCLPNQCQATDIQNQLKHIQKLNQILTSRFKPQTGVLHSTHAL
jgi:hypothetical protein